MSRWPSPEEQQAKLERMLREEFDLDPLPAFCIIVEGTTDVAYLRRAVELVRDRDGTDLLEVPKAVVDRPGEGISILTPRKPGSPNRGGLPQMVRLAEALRPYVFSLEIYSGIIFVLDHDEAGLVAQGKFEQLSFRKGQNTISLDPAEHPNACATKQVVIEDLLSLSIQQRFFALGDAWCSAEYERGELKRFKWGNESKGNLCEFVCKNGSLDDLREVARVILRARRIFGLPSALSDI